MLSWSKVGEELSSSGSVRVAGGVLTVSRAQVGTRLFLPYDLGICFLYLY